jgi:tripartite-type tricarboxylate transporter receptor subunit TctC
MSAHAQGYPSKPIRFVVPYPAGGPLDTVARLLGQKVSESTRQPVIVDNKPGAGGNIGADAVAKAAPDGYTLVLGGTGTLAINPTLYSNVGYDPRKDFAPIGLIGTSALVLVIHPSVPVHNVKELIAYAKANPGKLTYASAGVGSGIHLAGEYFRFQAGIEMTHVPYKGSAPAQQDVIGGRVPLLFDVLFSSMPFVKDGRMKVLALSSPKHAAANPEIPLIAESVPGFSAMSIIGVIAPAGVPRELLRRINADVVRAVKSPELSERMTSLGMEPVGSSPEEYDALIRTEIDKWAGVVKKAGIKIE